MDDTEVAMMAVRGVMPVGPWWTASLYVWSKIGEQRIARGKGQEPRGGVQSRWLSKAGEGTCQPLAQAVSRADPEGCHHQGELHGAAAASSALSFGSIEVSTEIVAEESPGDDASITIGARGHLSNR